MASYYNPATDLTYEQGADGIWRVEIGSGSAESLHYLGSITPPTDPATQIPDPKDGDFYIYDADGTAWNGEAVVAGYWVVYNPSNGWQNVGVRITTGVEEVDVSGGVLTLAGTASKPVINLDAVDLEAALDDRYLRIDGSSTYEGADLQMQNAGRNPTTVNNNDGLNLSTGNVTRLGIATNKISVNEDLEIKSGEYIEFLGDGLLNISSTAAGALTVDYAPVFSWDKDAGYMSKLLDMGDNKIENLADPTNAQDAATMAFVQANAYTLPTATDAILGGVKVGDTLSISLDGTLDVDPNSTFLPLTGGTLTGYTKVQGALFKIRFSGDTPGEFKFYSKDEQNVVRMVGGDTVDDSYMVYAGKCEANTHVLNRSHGDDRYLQLSGGTTTGAVTMQAPAGTGARSGFTLRGKDENGIGISLLEAYHQGTDGTRVAADAVNYYGRTDNTSNLINRAALDEALATVTGASLATKTIAGTVKVNVGSTEASATDAAYRNNDGHLYVMKAATGTNNNSTSGTQRGVAAFHSDSFSSSNGFITLKAATTSKIGGVKASSSSSDRSSAFCIDSDGTGKIRNATSSTIGVSKMGQICTKSSSLSSSDYIAGQMILRTDNKSVYIKI